METTAETNVIPCRQIAFEDALAVFDEQPSEVEPPRDIKPEAVFEGE